MARSSRDLVNGRGPLLRAAGGILWRAGRGSGPELALVHRPKHQDWSLPKGKLEPGETFADAALREVEEETGCRGALRAFAGYALYAVKGRDKLVLFWSMELVADLGFTPSDEIDAVAWLAPGEALSRLTHELEREILRDLLASRAIGGDRGAKAPSPALGRSLET